MNRYRGTQAEFQFSMVLPHTAHSKLLISRATIITSGFEFSVHTSRRGLPVLLGVYIRDPFLQKTGQDCG